MSPDTLALVAASLITVTGLAAMVVAVRGRSGVIPIELLIGDDLLDDEVDQFTRTLQAPMLHRLLGPASARMSMMLSSMLPRNHLANLERKLVIAGMSGRINAEELLSMQVVGAAVGAMVGTIAAVVLDWSGTGAMGLGIGATVLGFFGPLLWLSDAREKRVEVIERDLPDVLDVLAISVEAGVGFEGALNAVVERFTSPLGDELAHTLSEMELGLSRREALQNLRARTDVPDLTSFILSMLQAEALGMPITAVLKVQAGEMRRKRRAKVRETAAKLPVKLLGPLIMFILPSLFIVILGPAVLRIMGAFG